ncbi:MAG: 50S ribosomal protein L19 [Candidatus Kuenenbacteria bacterium]
MTQEKKESPEKPKQDTQKQLTKLPELKSGMTVCVHEKIKDIDAKGKERTRIQIFEGVILAVKKPKTPAGTILVRKTSHAGIGVEKIFPIHSPLIDKVEILKSIKARRAKLYFLRNYKKHLKTKQAKKS